MMILMKRTYVILAAFLSFLVLPSCRISEGSRPYNKNYYAFNVYMEDAQPLQFDAACFSAASRVDEWFREHDLAGKDSIAGLYFNGYEISMGENGDITIENRITGRTELVVCTDSLSLEDNDAAWEIYDGRDRMFFGIQNVGNAWLMSSGTVISSFGKEGRFVLCRLDNASFAEMTCVGVEIKVSMHGGDVLHNYAIVDKGDFRIDLSESGGSIAHAKALGGGKVEIEYRGNVEVMDAGGEVINL